MRGRIALVLALWLSACSGGEGLPNPVVGLAERVSAETVVIRTDDGTSLEFRNQDESVTVRHLEEHRIQRLPLKVTWQRRDGELVATAIEDG